MYKQKWCLGLLCVFLCVRVCVPSPLCSEGLLEEFLLVCRNEKLPQRALEIVQFSASFCLSTQKLARSVLADFDLTDEQRWGREKKAAERQYSWQTTKEDDERILSHQSFNYIFCLHAGKQLITCKMLLKLFTYNKIFSWDILYDLINILYPPW